MAPTNPGLVISDAKVQARAPSTAVAMEPSLDNRSDDFDLSGASFPLRMTRDTVLFPAVAAYVEVLDRWYSKVAMFVVWSALALGGLFTLQDFIGCLNSTVDAVPGTAAYDAVQQQSFYFPPAPLAGALLLNPQVLE